MKHTYPTRKNRIKSNLQVTAMILFFIAVLSIVGNMDYHDAVQTNTHNCETATYTVDYPERCE